MNKMIKPTIISISMATVMAGAAISPAMALIGKAFPEVSAVKLKLVLTIPSLMIVFFSFVSSFLIMKLPKRTILLIGLSIYVVAGTGAQFVQSINTLLAFRLLLGVGVGLIMPLSMSLINDYFDGKERTIMMGYNTAFSNFGGIVTVMVAGFLANMSWRAPFNVYLMGLGIMGLVYFFLPKNEVPRSTPAMSQGRIPWIIYGYGLAMGGIMVAYYSIATSMALYMEQNGIGGTALAGTIISFTTIGGMITSLTLVHIEDLLKKYAIHIMLLLMGLSFTFLSMTTLIPVIIVSVLFIGFGQGVLFPLILLKVIDQVEIRKSDRAVAITTSFIFLGQFLSPILLEAVSSIAANESVRFQYGFLAIAIFVIVAIHMALSFKKGPLTYLKKNWLSPGETAGEPPPRTEKTGLSKKPLK
ncbi:MFS transporter [Sporosarcina sp. 179-K 3D1 HS]|uniref:MFS transporter n=1 Tax=Sporosarcina sp. 179-K 3D1 HS TaxID=3232169 RepID=UPI0039A32AC5